MGRDPLRLRRAQGEYADTGRSRGHRVLPPASGALQSAEDRDFRGAAQDIDRQNPKVRPARESQAALSEVVGSSPWPTKVRNPCSAPGSLFPTFARCLGPTSASTSSVKIPRGISVIRRTDACTQSLFGKIALPPAMWCQPTRKA